MAKPIGVGALFQEDSHSVFMRITGSRYDGLCDRLEKKKLPPLTFSKVQFRAHVLAALGGREDGACKCRYCNFHFSLPDLAVDHANPLSRGGSTGLDNLEFPCKPCNNRKGSMSPGEYLSLLAFLETIPLARIDVLKRLEQSVALAAGARGNAAVIHTLKQTGQWQAVQASRREKMKAKKDGLPKF
jgi:hypothetical protein